MRHKSLKKFLWPPWELICRNKWHLGTSEIFTPPEIVVGRYFHAWRGTKTTPVFLPGDGEASWSLLPRSVSLLSGGTVQLENMYSCILKVTGQVGAKSHVCKGYRGKLVGCLALILNRVKNFTISPGKNLWWSLFLIKLQALRPVPLLKCDSNTRVFLKILQSL